MPDLPTLTVTAAQAQRCLDVWGSVAAYKAWLRGVVAAYVLAEETRREVEPHEATARAIRAAKAADDPLSGAT